MLRVIQDAPVLVGIVGESETSEKNIAGYLVVHEQDWAGMVRLIEAALAETRPR